MKFDEVISAIEGEEKNLASLSSHFDASKVRLQIFKATMDSVSNGGNATRKITEKIEQETAQLVDIEKKINESKAKLSAYLELKEILPKQQNFKLREGTEIANVEKFIRSAGRALTLDEIVKKLAESDDKLKADEAFVKKKKSLRGTLRAYVREGKVFCDGQQPDTYALSESKMDSQNPTN